jgi:hypothetical protein
MGGECYDLQQRCIEDSSVSGCIELSECINSCFSQPPPIDGTDSCIDNCKNNANKTALNLFIATEQCANCTACVDQCQADTEYICPDTNVIYMFPTEEMNGNFLSEYSQGIDTDFHAISENICRDQLYNKYPYLPSENVKMLISIDDDYTLNLMSQGPVNIPSEKPITGPNGLIIANSWTELISSNLISSPCDADVLCKSWWSGSSAEANLSSTCEGWHKNTTSDGSAGNATATDSKWLNGINEVSCGSSLPCLCVAWNNDNNNNDTEPPNISNTEITPSEISKTTIILIWTEASDNITSAKNLKYQIVRSATVNLATIEDIQTAINNNNATITEGWTDKTAFSIISGSPEGLIYTAEGLTENTKYFFNVMVKDEQNNIASYNQVSVTTASQ